MLKGKTVTVGVTGGIAVYKACEIVSRLKKLGAAVHVVMTKGAKEFVSPLTFETLTGNKVISEMFDPDRQWEVEHISLAKKTDVFLVAPCTANMAGKLASGIADDFMSTTLMAARCPIILAPAMNTKMLESAAYRDNEAVLRRRGFLFVGPEAGLLACGDEGGGRLAPVEDIINTVTEVLCPKQDLRGKSVLVTAGSTREYIDPVRYITNRSSGKMGIELALSAAKRGADVILVAGFCSVALPQGIKLIRAETTEEMRRAVLDCTGCDYYIMAAAPADYRLEKPAEQKIKEQELTLKFVKSLDIAAEIGKNKAKGGYKLIIFAAETQNLVENARKKLKAKKADLVVANDVTMDGAGFDCDTNIVKIINAESISEYPKLSKSAVADVILSAALALK